MARTATRDRPELPVGTITFLRTDIEGSMRLVRELGPAYDRLQAAHHALLRGVFSAHDGIEVGTEGDAFFVVFQDAGRAVRAAVEVQRSIAAHAWPDGVVPRIRIGLHAGTAYRAGDDYGGFDVNRAARVAAVGSGGQIVLSDPVRALVANELPDGVTIRDLGRYRLKGIPEPERLFQLDVDGLPTDFPPLRGTVDGAGNLPARITSFVGRSRELDRLASLLETSRLVTLTGPGGSGKTSLAVELARHAESGFPDGAWFVDLAPIRDPSLVKATIARTLGLYDGVTGPAADRLEPHLAERATLLLLDNFEQLLDAAGEVSTLLRASPATKVLVASRAPLRISAEQEVPVGPLPVARDDGAAASAAHDAGAIDLFLDRARSVRPDLSLTPDDERAVAEICRLLDGLPLGIELAAARVAMLPITAIRDRLAARLPLPGTGPRDLPARQRTLEDAIGWSVELLDEPARRLFDRTGVFDGSFDLAQAEIVCATPESGVDVLDGLARLTEQSLLGTATGDGDTGVRFRTLETIRTAALRRLHASGDEAALRTNHARAYADLAARAAPDLPGPGQARWLDRLAADNANLRAAVLWSVDHVDTGQALLLVAHLWRYWLLSGRLHEGRELIDKVFAMPGADEPTPERVRALDAAAGMAYWHADSERADGLYREQLRLAEELGLAWEVANATFNVAHSHFAMGDPRAASAALERARERAQAVGDERMVLRIEWSLTAAAQYQGQVEEALERFADLVKRFEASGDIWYQGMSIGSVAWGSIALGDMRRAVTATVESIRIAYELRDVADTTISLQIGAVIALAYDRPREAAAMLGAFEALCELYGVRPPAGLSFLVHIVGSPWEKALAALGQGEYDEAFAEGARMTMDEAVDYLVELGRTVLAS